MASKRKKISEAVSEAEANGLAPFWRQGDVGLIKVANIPATAKEVKHDGVLAYGEVTGHKHQLTDGKVRYFRTDEEPNKLYFKVESRFASLNHGLGVGKANVPTVKEEDDEKTSEEGHFTQDLPKGTYALLQQNEFDWMTQQRRIVED